MPRFRTNTYSLFNPFAVYSGFAHISSPSPIAVMEIRKSDFTRVQALATCDRARASSLASVYFYRVLPTAH